jgi:D-ribose pyranose/furanose isomerase RbsD
VTQVEGKKIRKKKRKMV